MNPIPWYQSKTLRGLLIAILAQAAVLLNITDVLDDATIAASIDRALDLIALAASAYAAYGRTVTTASPLTLTASGADKLARRY